MYNSKLPIYIYVNYQEIYLPLLIHTPLKYLWNIVYFLWPPFLYSFLLCLELIVLSIPFCIYTHQLSIKIEFECELL